MAIVHYHSIKCDFMPSPANVVHGGANGSGCSQPDPLPNERYAVDHKIDSPASIPPSPASSSPSTCFPLLLHQPKPLPNPNTEEPADDATISPGSFPLPKTPKKGGLEIIPSSILLLVSLFFINLKIDISGCSPEIEVLRGHETSSTAGASLKIHIDNEWSPQSPLVQGEKSPRSKIFQNVNEV